jgi:hypothetical protein
VWNVSCPILPYHHSFEAQFPNGLGFDRKSAHAEVWEVRRLVDESGELVRWVRRMMALK